jgi:predicted nucleotidyltransferase
MPSGPVEQALAQAGVRFAYLFGSRASGESCVESDADVAIMGDRRLDLLERSRLAARLADALGVPDVDLVVLDEAGLRGRVVQEGRLIYSRDEPARVGFEVRTRSEYIDYLPTLRALERSYLARIAEDGL